VVTPRAKNRKNSSSARCYDSFDADYLNSIWVAAIPAFVGAAAVSYFAPSHWVERAWTNWLLIVPIVGLIVLGYSLQQYFVR
jgi:hypothetical protein